MKKHICLVVFPYDCHASGGIRNAAVGLVRTLVHGGCVVDVASPVSGNPREGKENSLGGVPVRSFRYYRRGVRDMAPHIAPDTDFVFLWWCTGDSSMFAKAAHWREIPYLYYSGGIFQNWSFYKSAAKFFWFNFSWFMRHCSAVVVPTQAELLQARREMPLHASIVHKISHEIPAFERKDSMHIRKIHKPITFGFLGRLDVEVKGLDVLTKAFVMLLEQRGCIARLLIGGPDWHGGKEKLVAIVPERLIKSGMVRICGPVFGEDKERWFDEIDVYVQMSRHEGFGIAIAEAMQREKPVLLSRKCNIAGEVLAAGAGIACSPKAGPVLKALMRILEIPTAELRNMGDAGKRWVLENCSLDAVGAKTIDLLEEVRLKKER